MIDMPFFAGGSLRKSDFSISNWTFFTSQTGVLISRVDLHLKYSDLIGANQ